jgi:hypothetical protein
MLIIFSGYLFEPIPGGRHKVGSEVGSDQYLGSERKVPIKVPIN